MGNIEVQYVCDGHRLAVGDSVIVTQTNGKPRTGEVVSETDALPGLRLHVQFADGRIARLHELAGRASITLA